MKLKRIVASMCMLGLISCPLLAATEATTETTATPTSVPASAEPTTPAETSTPTTTKVQHHHKQHPYKAHHQQAEPVAVVKEHIVVSEHDAGPHRRVVVERHDYKAMGALPIIMEACPRLDMATIIYDAMGQNTGRAKPTIDCTRLISVAGGLAADAHWGNRSIGYAGENNRSLTLNDAYLNVYGNVNDWVKAFVGLSYSNPSSRLQNSLVNYAAHIALPKPGRYSNVYSSNSLAVEQAFVTLANFDLSPFFVQVGKQYTDFSRYRIHPITRSMSQVLSESLQTSAKLGFITNMGLNGQLYLFNNPMTRFTNAHSKTVWGAALGFAQPNDQFGFDVGLGWMSNMTGVNDIAYAIGVANGSSFGGTGSYVHSVGAVAAYGDVNSGPFSLGARFTTATQNFSPIDLNTNYASVSVVGAKPWAADVTADYGFNGWGRKQNVYVGYQASNNAVQVFLPKTRWMAGYNIDVWKCTNLGLEWNHDKDYSSGNGASGRSSNTVAARLGVIFG